MGSGEGLDRVAYESWALLSCLPVGLRKENPMVEISRSPQALPQAAARLRRLHGCLMHWIVALHCKQWQCKGSLMLAMIVDRGRAEGA